MKYHVPLIMIFLMLVPCALGTTHLYSGADSYGKGLSYPVHDSATNISDNIPAFEGMPAIAGLYAGSYPGAYSPIFLGYSPVSSSPVTANNTSSDVYSLIGSIWTPYSIYHSGYTPMDVITLFPERVSIQRCK